MENIVIVNLGYGNLNSLKNVLKKVGHSSQISSQSEDIAAANKIILPGVGSFDSAVKSLNSLKLLKILDKKALDEKVPVLGVCLGMQLLTKSSEEGKLPGLGWIGGKTIRFKINSNLRIPHMGWNDVVAKPKNKLFKNMPPEPRFYFVHSYHVACDPKYIAATTNYGNNFTSAVQKENIFGVQFHPEKSHKYGMQLLKNFAEL